MHAVASRFDSLLKELFEVGVAAAQPHLRFKALWRQHLQQWLDAAAPNRQNVWVYGAGKASGAMAHALEKAAENRECLKGFVISSKGYKAPTEHIAVEQASHPVPCEDGQRLARRMLLELSFGAVNDPVIALVSGGGSALLSAPVRDIPFVDLQQLNRALLASGAPIDEINIVRKHVTQTLGGQMARACQGPLCQVIISDVPGDNPSLIASGPFSPDSSTFEQARSILDRWSIQAAYSVQRYLERGFRGKAPETPGDQTGAFASMKTHLLASPSLMLDAVSERLQLEGYHVLNFGDSVQGEAQDVAKVLSSVVRQAASQKGGWPSPPLALISGGETTVTLKESNLRQARGGRNTEFLLALSYCLRDLRTEVPIAAISADTDGADGVGGHAGAVLLPGDLDQVRDNNMDAQRHLNAHTSFDYFQLIDRLVVTGPTATNVNDLRIVLIGHPRWGRNLNQEM